MRDSPSSALTPQYKSLFTVWWWSRTHHRTKEKRWGLKLAGGHAERHELQGGRSSCVTVEKGEIILNECSSDAFISLLELSVNSSNNAQICVILCDKHIFSESSLVVFFLFNSFIEISEWQNCDVWFDYILFERQNLLSFPMLLFFIFVSLIIQVNLNAQIHFFPVPQKYSCNCDAVQAVLNMLQLLSISKN